MDEVGINFQYGVREQGLLLNILLTSFIFFCVFDPANVLFDGKILVFIALWLYSFFLSQIHSQIPPILYLYVGFFVGVPLLSLAVYLTYGGSSQFEGFNLLKGYVLITFSILLVRLRVNILPRLSLVLSSLAITMIATAFVFNLYPETKLIVRELSRNSGLIFLQERDFGNDVVIDQIYFSTSPMLLISMAYYYLRMKLDSKAFFIKIKTGFMALLSFSALIVGGTRSNILSAVILLIILWTITSNNKRRDLSIIALVLVALNAYFINDLAAFFDPSEYSNNLKLNLVEDYFRIMSNVRTIFLGQGLGAYVYWNSRGYEFYISELTYFEIFRNFGFPGGTIIILLLLFPLYKYLQKKDVMFRGLGWAYLMFLILCFFNPNLFNSMGVTIISMMLANLHIPKAHIL